MDNVNSVGVKSMMTHRVIFDLKVHGGGTEARELELIANSADAWREAHQMLFRAYGDRAQITAFEDKAENYSPLDLVVSMRDSHDPTSAETLRNYLNSLPVEVDSGSPELPSGLREHVSQMRESRVYWASLEEVTFAVDKTKGCPYSQRLRRF